ncbi:MAG TPA: hypothetical protein VKP08_13140 [Anaerolineales bacterium]|nr:hypothetical protein [Anaerolineales bacterium]
MHPDYPIRKKFIRFHDWKPLPPLSFNWEMKPLSSARTDIRVLANGQFELTISHDVIKGVTPAMLHWWFSRIDTIMEYQGQMYPRYRVWHPFDHIYYQDLSHAPDGTGSAGTRRHIVEAFGADTRYLTNIIDRVVHLDDKGILLSTEQCGISIGLGSMLMPVPLGFSSLEHQFIPVSNGTRYESRLLIGVDSAMGKRFFNPVVRPLFIGYEMARAWLKHNVEEVGNFEFFLPALYARYNDGLPVGESDRDILSRTRG